MRILLAALLLVAASTPALAQTSTPLLQDDLAANKRTRIDAADDGLDALMGGSGSGFSTRKLETVEDRLRADLKRERPRATPRLVIFLYPGKVSAQRLRALSEIFVDMELVIDPCDRSVCRDAVAHHIEMVGRAVGQAVIATQDYKIVFKDLRLQTSTPMHDAEVDSYLVPIADCIAAGKRPGGGRAWLDGRKKADTDYEPLLVKEITRNAQRRRVQLTAPRRCAGARATCRWPCGSAVIGCASSSRWSTRCGPPAPRWPPARPRPPTRTSRSASTPARAVLPGATAPPAPRCCSSSRGASRLHPVVQLRRGGARGQGRPHAARLRRRRGSRPCPRRHRRPR